MYVNNSQIILFTHNEEKLILLGIKDPMVIIQSEMIPEVWYFLVVYSKTNVPIDPRRKKRKGSNIIS